MNASQEPYRADSRDPEMNIATLPAQLFFLLNGSLSEPNLLPIMSAKPAKPRSNQASIMGFYRRHFHLTITAAHHRQGDDPDRGVTPED
jgi:hypothetical protein